MAQLSASAVRSTCSTAARFGTGRLPGSPRQTGQQCVLGAAPNSVLQPQNILLAVSSSACTSMPITASYRVVAVISSPERSEENAKARKSENAKGTEEKLGIRKSSPPSPGFLSEVFA